MKNILIALAMAATFVSVGSPAQAEEGPITSECDPSGGNECEPVECRMSGGSDVCDPLGQCEQVIEDAFWTYSQLQWQIELTQRAELKIERKQARIERLKQRIHQLKKAQ